MDTPQSSMTADAIRAYVRGDTSEPAVLSFFKDVPIPERTHAIAAHRAELEAIDAARLTILESMILPLDDRAT